MGLFSRWFRKSATSGSQTVSGDRATSQAGPPQSDLAAKNGPPEQEDPPTTYTKSAEPAQPTHKDTLSSDSTATAASYLLSSKKGTEPSVFYEYVRSITGEAEKRDHCYPDIPWQSATVDLTPEQAKDAESQPFMEIVALVTTSEEELDSSHD